jgi:hypothetical protein
VCPWCAYESVRALGARPPSSLVRRAHPSSGYESTSSSDTAILVRPPEGMSEKSSVTFEGPPPRSPMYTEAASMICPHLRSGRSQVDPAYWRVIPPQGLLSNAWPPPALVLLSLMSAPVSNKVSARSSCVEDQFTTTQRHTNSNTYCCCTKR